MLSPELVQLYSSLEAEITAAVLVALRSEHPHQSWRLQHGEVTDISEYLDHTKLVPLCIDEYLDHQRETFLTVESEIICSSFAFNYDGDRLVFRRVSGHPSFSWAKGASLISEGDLVSCLVSDPQAVDIVTRAVVGYLGPTVEDYRTQFRLLFRMCTKAIWYNTLVWRWIHKQADFQLID